MSREYFKGQREEQRAYSRAVQVRGGTTVYLAGIGAPVDAQGNSLAGNFTAQINIETDLGYRCECVATGSVHGPESDDVRNDPRLLTQITRTLNQRTRICCPLLTRYGEFLGVLDLSNKNGGEPFNDNDARFLEGLCRHIVIALENNRLVVGCDNDVILSSNQRGSAYVFERTGSLWNLRQKVIAPAGSAGDLFGNGVSLSGDTILVGAPQTMINTLSNAGAAYLFTLQLGNSLPTVTPYGPYTIQSGSTLHKRHLVIFSVRGFFNLGCPQYAAA